MEGEDIRALRKRLGLSMKDLADHLGTEVGVVSAWESGTRYATKQHVDMMRALDASPPAPRPARGLFDGFLSDAKFAPAVRKLLAHEEMQAEFLKLAERYEDPAED